MPPRGKQLGVQEGSLLQLLRSAGFQAELPPSTVAWLENAPVFKFLSSKIGSENFVAPGDQQEYTEIMMAKGPNADLYDALGSGSDDEMDDEQQQDQLGDDGWMGAASDADVEHQVQAKEQYVKHLEQQIATLKALSGHLDASTRKQRSRQPLYINLQAQANHELASAKAELSKLNAELNGLLQGLQEVCSSLASLAEVHPEQWLLCAADLGSYGEEDEAANQLFIRGMKLLNAARVVRQLDPSATPAAAAADGAVGSPAWRRQQLHQLDAGVSPQRAAGAVQAPILSALIHTPQRQQPDKQQQQSLLTPRARGMSNRAEALLAAEVKRHADQEARNAALMRELTRQRLSFNTAWNASLRAEVKHAGMRGRLAAAEQVRYSAGGFAQKKKEGPASIAELQHAMTELEQERQLLGLELPNLIGEWARLNDTHIVAADYDMQLRKMALTAERKGAVLQKLLDVTSRHLLLLMLRGQECSRLGWLSEELHAAHAQLEGHVDRVRARVNSCAAGAHALQQAQQRSNLQSDDSYLLALLAAASDSSLAVQPSTGAAAAADSSATAAAEPGTPLNSLAAALASTPRSSHTPSYRQSRDLTDQLQHLSSSSQQRSSQLQQLLEKLPQQLDRHLATAKQLHLLAFPPGQSCAPLVPAPAHHHGQIGSSAGGWDNASSAGAASAAPSIRSLRSASSSAASSGGHHNHPLPLLRVPEVAEAQQQLEACCQGLGRDMHRLVMKQNEYAVVMNQQRGELEVERSVMRLFFTQPQELAAHVERLKGEVEALELARELAVGQQ